MYNQCMDYFLLKIIQTTNVLRDFFPVIFYTMSNFFHTISFNPLYLQLKGSVFALLVVLLITLGSFLPPKVLSSMVPTGMMGWRTGCARLDPRQVDGNPDWQEKMELLTVSSLKALLHSRKPTSFILSA